MHRGYLSTAKDKYIMQMCEKLKDHLTAPKAYWKILNLLLSNKKVFAIQISLKKLLSLKSTLHHNVPCYKIQAVYQRFD